MPRAEGWRRGTINSTARIEAMHSTGARLEQWRYNMGMKNDATHKNEQQGGRGVARRAQKWEEGRSVCPTKVSFAE